MSFLFLSVDTMVALTNHLSQLDLAISSSEPSSHEDINDQGCSAVNSHKTSMHRDTQQEIRSPWHI